MKKPVIIASVVGAAVLAIAAAVLVPNYSTSSIAEVDAYRHTIGVASAGRIASNERIATDADASARVSSVLEGSGSYDSLVTRVRENGATCENAGGYVNAGRDAAEAGAFGEITPTMRRFSTAACEQDDFIVDIDRVWKGQPIPDWSGQGRLVSAAADGAIITVQVHSERNNGRGPDKGLAYVESADVSVWAAAQISTDTGASDTVDCGDGDLATHSGSAVDCLATEGSGSTYPIRVTFRQAGEPQSHYELEVGSGPVVFG